MLKLQSFQLHREFGSMVLMDSRLNFYLCRVNVEEAIEGVSPGVVRAYVGDICVVVSSAEGVADRSVLIESIDTVIGEVERYLEQHLDIGFHMFSTRLKPGERFKIHTQRIYNSKLEIVAP